MMGPCLIISFFSSHSPCLSRRRASDSLSRSAGMLSSEARRTVWRRSTQGIGSAVHVPRAKYRSAEGEREERRRAQRAEKKGREKKG